MAALQLLSLALLVPQLSAPAQLAQGAGSDADQISEQEELVDDDLRQLDRPSEKLQFESVGLPGWLLLDWAGARTELEDLGLQIEMIYTLDGSWALGGGAQPGDTALRGLLDLSISYDTEPVLGLKGGTLLVGFQEVSGTDASTRFGVAQAFSNIDSEERLQVARVWYEQSVEATNTRIRVGKIDANSLFAYVEHGGQFLHSSMGFSPTIFLLPTYPDAAFGAAVVQGIGGGFEVRAGVFDGSFAQGVRTGQHGPSTLFESPHDLFSIGEANLAWAGDKPGRLGIGAWNHSADLARFDGAVEDGTNGLYALVDQHLWSPNDDVAAGVDAFLQLGLADPEVSPFESHLGVGVVWNDPWERRAERLGFGLSHVKLSDEPGAGFGEDHETAFELFYGFEPVSWMRVKPDLQYVVHPGGNPAHDDAWILSLRLTFSL